PRCPNAGYPGAAGGLGSSVVQTVGPSPEVHCRRRGHPVGAALGGWLRRGHHRYRRRSSPDSVWHPGLCHPDHEWRGILPALGATVDFALRQPTEFLISERRWQMTPRFGLYVGLVGLVMAVLCCATLFLLRDFNPHPHVGDRLVILYFTFIIAVDLAAILGLI